MCFGIVGRIAALPDDRSDLADIDVAGVVRPINVALLDRGALRPGDWILIHAGFALEQIDEDTARLQIAALRAYTGDPGPG
jgi:hydrogenase expression/formation protein HypC